MESVSWGLRANDFSSAHRRLELGEYESADTPTIKKLNLLDNVALKASAASNWRSSSLELLRKGPLFNEALPQGLSDGQNDALWRARARRPGRGSRGVAPGEFESRDPSLGPF